MKYIIATFRFNDAFPSAENRETVLPIEVSEDFDSESKCDEVLERIENEETEKRETFLSGNHNKHLWNRYVPFEKEKFIEAYSDWKGVLSD